MGSGAPRELADEGELQPLPEKLSRRLGAALEQFDGRADEFKLSRDEERGAQHVKIWGQTCKEMDRMMRRLGETLNAEHQLSLDIGSDGGGGNTSPWFDEERGFFARLHFRLKDGHVWAISGDRKIDKTKLSEVHYEWIELATVKWLVGEAENAVVNPPEDPDEDPPSPY